MYLLFAGLTFLIAHVFIFAGRDVQWFLQQFFSTELWLFAMSYVVAAVVAGMLFYIGKLHIRLPKPIAGRKTLIAGVTIYVLYLLCIYGGLLAYRPGMGLLIKLALYLPPIAMMLILLGVGKTLLNSKPDPQREHVSDSSDGVSEKLTTKG
jgi:hypothetical protein